MTKEQDDLLQELSSATEDGGGVGRVAFRRAVMMIVILFLIFGPKILITQQIYYKSIEISKLRTLHQMLREENNYLRQQLEIQKFKNEILDRM
ncbi:MAG: hypothetical protein K6347_04380 [Campylobacterales bacterium]